MQQLPKLGIMGWVKVLATIGLALLAIVAAFFFLGFLLVIGLVVAAIVAGWSAVTGRKPKSFRSGPKVQSFHFTDFTNKQSSGQNRSPNIIEGDYETVDDKKG